MKRLSLLLFALLLSSQAISQEVVEKTYPFVGQELDLDMDLGEQVIISSWDKDEISVKVTYEINNGDANDAMELDIDDYKDRLSIDIDLDKRKLRGTRGCREWRRSRGQNYYSSDDGDNVCAEIIVEVFMPKEADLFVKTVIADVEIENMLGNVEVETVTGYIDVAWAKELGADVRLKTVTGAVYTNLDIEQRSRSDRGLRVISSRDIKGVYKQGGKEVNLESVTSDIYLRTSDQ